MFLALHKRLHDREEGFTLIELLVVVIIIGILAAVAIPTFLNQRQRAFRSAAQADLRNIAIEAETFFTDNATYDGLEGDAVFTGFRESPGVTIAMAAAESTATAYCITADHASIGGAGVDFVYDSDAGGIRQDTDCTP